MTPIPVLHVVNCTVDGSITRVVERIIHGLDGAGFEWHVCGVKGLGELAQPLRELGVKVVDGSPTVQDNIPAWKKIRRYMSANGIQIVHSHTMRTTLEVWRAMHVAGPALPQKVIHVSTKHTFTSPNDRRNGLLYAGFDRFCLYLPDQLVAVSHTMAGQFTAFPGLHTGRVTAIPNAIPCELYDQSHNRIANRQRFGVAPDKTAIGFTGRLAQVKRLDLLLQAFVNIHLRFPNTQLLLAGDGELRTRLETLTDLLGLRPAVTWLGFCRDIPAFLSALDIYVQPSANEGLSLSLLEAMAAGVPVVTTRVGSAEEVICSEHMGILIPPNSAREIENALGFLLEHPQERAALASCARQRACEAYSVQRMADSYGQLYCQLLRSDFAPTSIVCKEESRA